MSNRIHPLTQQAINEKPQRIDLATRFSQVRRMRNTYDAARSGTDLDNHWIHADAGDADSANNPTVRHTLAKRSRYEAGSSGYYAGIIRTHVNMMVGVGPTLRMLTGNAEFNQAIERQWYAWTKATQLRRKLWCMGHARTLDGESFGLLTTNPVIPGRVQLDLLLIETEQCQTPYMPYLPRGYIDGIRFDEWNNILWYDILPYHPGSTQFFVPNDAIPVPAAQVLHWFKMERPGQHRSVPDLTSTLTTGAMSRRFREATVSAAETAADISAMLESTLSPAGDEEPDPVQPLSTFETQRRMLMALPFGWTAKQMEAQHPNAQYGEFNRTLVSEQARPLSMPYNAAACDSSTYSFASGKLDTLCYRAALNVEREDCNDLVLDPLFAAWFREWTLVESMRDAPLSHQWDWPAHPVIDVEADANANDKRLRNGTTSLRRVYSDAGMDYEDELQAMAEDFGVTPDEMRTILLRTLYPSSAPPQRAPEAVDQHKDVAEKVTA